MGVFFSFLALIGWGLGDFFIQRAARRSNSLVAIIFVTASAAIIFLPFVFFQPSFVFSTRLFGLLFLAALGVLVTAPVGFESLRVGKISVVAPIYSFEVVLVALLSWLTIGERLSFWQLFLIAVLFVGLFLVSTEKFSTLKKITTERGVGLAILSTVGLAYLNLIYGIIAREAGPFFGVWFANGFVCLVFLFFLLWRGQGLELVSGWQKHRGLFAAAGVVSTSGWVFYSFAAIYLPIAIATAITQGYIVLAVILGILFNREKLRRHQVFGLLVTIITAVYLALLC